MSYNFISASHVEKLGHKIPEIRERALVNLISKLDRGFIYDNELARCREILQQLLNWLEYKPLRNELIVLQLIRRILQSESGKTLIQHYDTNEIDGKFRNIRPKLQPKSHEICDEILKIINNSKINAVPPLETNTPLSYRSGQSDKNIGSTASTYEGFIQEYSFKDQQTSNRPTYTVRDSSGKSNISCTLKWQELIETDQNVLKSFENNLKHPDDALALLRCCDFFNDVLIHDFPAEIFIQRPTVLNVFANLIADNSTNSVVNGVFSCLTNLTQALKLRVNYNNDPSIRNTKSFIIESSRNRSFIPNGGTNQITIPEYAVNTLKMLFKYLTKKNSSGRKIQQVGYNNALKLIDNLFGLLYLCLNKKLWNEECNTNQIVLRSLLNGLMVDFGDILKYFRIESQSDQTNHITFRAIYINLIMHFIEFLHNFIPSKDANKLLDRNLKIELNNILIDVTLIRLYPNIYEEINDYIQNCDDEDLGKYELTNRLCQSIVCAVKFLRKSENLDFKHAINLVDSAIDSLEFHENFVFIQRFIDICTNQLPLNLDDHESVAMVETSLIKLLTSNHPNIQEKTYELCRKIVIAAIGPKLNLNQIKVVPGSQIIFLTTSNIMNVIALYGLTNNNLKIREYSEDILIHLIKSKILITDDIWFRILESLFTSIPILLAHVNSQMDLSKLLMEIFDPDTAKNLDFLTIEVIKGNILLLFNPNESIRIEAISRLLWLLSLQNDSKQLLPKLHHLNHHKLPNICQLSHIMDVNKYRHTQEYYQASNLQQLINLLENDQHLLDSDLRKSALIQLSVMLEDHLIHQQFYESNGLKLIKNQLGKCLLTDDLAHYPESIVPIANILKNLCLFNSVVRQNLHNDLELFYHLLRSLLMFYDDDNLRMDISIVVILLIFHSYIRGTPQKSDFALPALVAQNFDLPFICQHYQLINGDKKITDDLCMNSIRIQWNLEIADGIDGLIQKKIIKDLHTVESMQITENDLFLIKMTSIDYCIRNYLNDLQNAVTHDAVIKIIQKLTNYLWNHKKLLDDTQIYNYEWENTFARFLNSLPSSDEDLYLLNYVLNFLNELIGFYRKINDCWLTNLLLDPKNCLLDLLYETDDDYKVVNQNLLKLIKNSVSIAYDDGHQWTRICKLINDQLKFTDTEQFLHLAYLNELLSCLMYLTANSNWWNDKLLIYDCVRNVCELIAVLHNGKGDTSSLSLMGCSIIRNALFVLNHSCAALQTVKDWHDCFIDMDCDWLTSLVALISSRDLFARAATLQLFAGLFGSKKITEEILLKFNLKELIDLTFRIMIDHEESAIVRENSINFLINLFKYTNDYNNYLEKYHFYDNLEIILNCLYTNLLITNRTSMATEETKFNITTPSLVKNLMIFLNNLASYGIKDFEIKLQEMGLIKLILRCLCNPTMSIENNRKLSLHCDLIEMNTKICAVLNRIACKNSICLGTILYTKDCLNELITLLNPKCYYTHLKHLQYLRNKNWLEIYQLIVILYENSSESHRIIMEIWMDSGQESFLSNLKESLCTDSKELQQSALLSLASFLNHQNRSIEHFLDENLMIGRDLCKILMNLYEITPDQQSFIICALTNILSASRQAKKCALENNFLQTIIRRLKDFYVELNLESIDYLKKSKPIIRHLDELIGLITNLMAFDQDIKNKMVLLNLGDHLNKLWVWCCIDKTTLNNTIKLLCTFTNDCLKACRSMALTNSTKQGLLHEIFNLVDKEMDQISKTHDMETIRLALLILENCSVSIECRLIIAKSGLFRNITRLHPAITKRQKNYFQIELYWIQFLEKFTSYPEGQASVAKQSDVFEWILILTGSVRKMNRVTSLTVLRNLAFYSTNRTRLLNSNEFLNLLKTKLSIINISTVDQDDERDIIVLIMWSLAANNQKAKSIFKSLQLDERIDQCIKRYRLTNLSNENDDMIIKKMIYLLQVIR